VTLTVRPFVAADAPALSGILNAIIEFGGTTAYQVPFTPQDLRGAHLDGPTVICCHTALLDGVPVGFQCLNRVPYLPEGWGDIATFTRRTDPVPGAGRALFAATHARAVELGLIALNATIRADNHPGLRYYARLGFADYGVYPAVPLDDGTAVDRIRRRFDLA
jgi:RimJ/RimL family protein N-acetyltransferase